MEGGIFWRVEITVAVSSVDNLHHHETLVQEGMFKRVWKKLHPLISSRF